MIQIRNRLIIILSIVFILLGGLFYVGLYAPFNLLDMVKSNSFGIINNKDFKEIDELTNYFKNDKINKINYLGSDTYEVFTDKGEFIVVADYHSDPSFWKYKIFKLDKKLKYFTNPM